MPASARRCAATCWTCCRRISTASLAVNLRGTVFLTQAVGRGDAGGADAGRGARTIVFVTSVSAAMASPERPTTASRRPGSSMWSEGLALRLAPEGIAVFEVRPGIIRTDMTAGVAANYDARIAGGLVPARRWGEARGHRRRRGRRLCVAAPSRFATGSMINVATAALSIAEAVTGRR